jgi:hypothetical protein
MSDTDVERIATLENKSANHESKISDLSASLKSIDKNVNAILLQMASSKGFFHGIAFTLSILGGIIGAFAAELWHTFSGTK